MKLAIALLLCSSAAFAQGPEHVHPAAAPATAPATTAWQWSTDGNAFVGFNYQKRKFRDFKTWESQNWWMGMGQRRVGAGTLTLSSMLSLEPLTLKDIGSPQVFQTGETFRLAPLIDYQHPHDLLMNLGGDYQRPAGPFTLLATVALVGDPALGPTAFMHRPSARDNPEAPLSHHYLDSTHITPGVVTGGLGIGAWRVEASRFHGREPDENRLDVDLGPLDSTSMRLSWQRGPWSAQASGAYLTQPELINPYDAKKITASVAYTAGSGRIAWLAGFGQNREIHGNLEAYLFEATIVGPRSTHLYTRVESAAKDILDAGYHPRGTFHRHRQSQVSAFTIGVLHDLVRNSAGTWGAGGDVTGYVVPANLLDSYGSPVSFHVFLRYRLGSPASAPVHVH